jgi:hypothetical protein
MSVIITTEIFLKRAKEKHGDKFDYLLVEYKKQNEKVKIICPIHGEFLMEPRNHLRSNSGCDKCKINVNKTTYDFINQVKKIHNNKYDYSNTEYVNKHNKIKIICPIHGEFEIRARHHLSGTGCKLCGFIRIGDFSRHSTSDFISKAKIIHGDKYDYKLVDYINQRKKVDIICKIHGSFNQEPIKHLNGCGCKKCSESKGERIIREYLEYNNIEYLPQHKFKNCRFKNELPFDFYLPKHNMCIEFNGAQHYKPVKYWGGTDTLKKIKNRDKIKKSYCISNSIKLLIIRYNEDILPKLKLKII